MTFASRLRLNKKGNIQIHNIISMADLNEKTSKKNVKRNICVFIFALLPLLSNGATWYSVNGTSITNIANWRANTDGTGASPGSFAAGDVFILQAGHTCTMFVDMNMAGTLTVNGVLTPPDARIIGGTGTLNGTGIVLVTRTTATASFAAQYPIANKTLTNLTVDYASTTGDQVITGTTYGHLKLSNTSGTNTAGGNIIVNGSLTTSFGGTFELTSAYTLTGTLTTITNNGTIRTSVLTTTSATPLASGKTWGGMGTVNYTAITGAQTIVGGTYNNVTLSNTSGTNVAGNSFATTGILTTTDDGILNLAGTTATLAALSATASSIGGGSVVLNGNVTTSALTSNDVNLSAANFSLNGAARTFDIGLTGVLANDANIGAIIGTGRVVKEGEGNIVFSGTNTYSGGTTINNGTIAMAVDNFGAIPGAATPNHILFEGGGVDFNGTFTIHPNRGITLGPLGGTVSISAVPFPTQQIVTYGGIMAGTGTLTKVRSGKLVLSGANTYSGGTAVTRGVVNIQHASALGGPTGLIGTTVSADATLQLEGGIAFNSQPLTLNGIGFNGVSGALQNVSGNNTWQSTVTLASASTIRSEANTLTLSNPNSVTAVNQNLTLSGAGNGLINGTITTGTGSVTHDGTGTWRLGASNSYTGATTISGAGTLALGVDNAIHNSSAVNIVASTGILDLAGRTDEVGSLAGVGRVTSSSAGNPSFTVGHDNTSTTFSGIIQNGSATTVSLTKVGNGTLTLSGSNTHSGTTQVSDGSLALGAINTLGSGPMVLNGGAVSTGGFANTTGTLQVTDSSALILGGGAVNALRFSASNALSWTAGQKLTISNWTGALTSIGSSGTTGQVFVGNSATGLTATQLSQIQFLISGTYYMATQLSTGEVVPTNIPLDITLLYFNVRKAKEGALVEWSTSSEKETKGYRIERMCQNDSEWETIGTIQALSEPRAKTYTLMDDVPCNGLSYYKLVEVALDGDYDYSVALLDYGYSISFSIYPNPSDGYFEVSLWGSFPHYDLSILNLLGQELKTARIFNGTSVVDYSNFASGLYMARIKVDKEWVTHKIVIEK